MKRIDYIIRNTLYKTFDLPADDYSTKLYTSMMDQRKKEMDTIRDASGVGEQTFNILNNIRKKAHTTSIPLKKHTVRKPRRILQAISAVAAAAVLILLIVPSDSYKRGYLKIASWKGNPRISEAGEKILLAGNGTVGEGSTIATGPGERITIYRDGTHITLSEKTVLRLSRLKVVKKLIAAINLQSGSAVFSLDKQQYSRFTVQTPLGSVIVTGTIFSVDVQKSRLRVAIRRGSVLFRQKQSDTLHRLPADRGLTFDGSGIKIRTLSDSAEFKDLRLLIDRTQSGMKQDKTGTMRIKNNEPTANPSRLQHPATTQRPSSDRQTGHKGRGTIKPVFRTGRTVRIHLKNGSIVRGKIIRTDSDQIRVRTSYSTMHINRQQIMKITEVK